MAKRDDASKRYSFNLGSWFSWNGTVSPAKGTAGGNFRVGLPHGSRPLGIVAYLFLALVIVSLPLTAWGIAAVLMGFAGREARLWLIELWEKWSPAVLNGVMPPAPVPARASSGAPGRASR